MWIKFGSAVADAYVAWTLFLSSYVPLLAIFSLRLSEKQRDYAFWTAVLGAVIALNLILLLNMRIAPRDFRVGAVQSSSSEVSAYIAIYLLPFLVVSDVGLRDLLAYILLILSIGIVITRDGSLHVNPLLALLGYRFFTIETETGDEYFLLARRRVERGQTVRVVQVRARLLLER